MNLANKVAFVTGAGRGIGKAIALMIANAGGHVIPAGDYKKARWDYD